jgi:hypothetical protein
MQHWEILYFEFLSELFYLFCNINIVHEGGGRKRGCGRRWVRKEKEKNEGKKDVPFTKGEVLVNE